MSSAKEDIVLSLMELSMSQSQRSWKKFNSNKLEAEKAMAPHSSTLAWKIPWTEEPDRLRSMGLLRLGHD